MSLPAGSTLGGYRIEGLLGRGGMGAVYRALDVRGGGQAALKVIAAELADDSQFRERFRREAGAAAALDHPHAVRVLEAGEEGGVLFLAMRLVDGEDLATMLERERLLGTEHAVGLVGQVASALDAAHATGLVHRDVKPANVLVEQRTGGPHAYLTDFGVARRLQEQSRLTRTGMVVGTPGYLAPEALRGEGAGPAVDIYALGCVLFETLTGVPPFEGENDVALILAHVEDPPPSLAARVPGAPAALDRVIQRALAKDPAARFASASAFARAAHGALRGEKAFTIRASGVPTSETMDLPVSSLPSQRSTPVRKEITMVYVTPGVDIGVDPEVRLGASERFERLARPILERYGATIEASPTEGVVAVFGLPTLREDDAPRGVRSALALREELGTGAGGGFAPTCSVITDVVVTGGETPRATSLGSLLQRALRMHEAAAPGDVLVTGATRELARNAASYEAADSTTAAERIWRATGAAPDLADGWAGQRRLLGRENELETLERALSEAIHSRSARLVTVLGAPGIGKSCLASGFAGAITSRASVAVTRCRPPGEADSREPIRELLGQLAGAEQSAFVRTTLEGDDAETIAERVERLLSLREGPVPADELPWVVRRFLSDVARRRPLVALIEDVHWAEPALLELIEHVGEWTKNAPLLLVCMARPELFDDRPDWGEGAEGVRIALDPLSREASLALVEDIRDAEELTDMMRDRIVQAAEGNPLFVEQMVSFVRDSPDRGDAMTSPPNIHSLLAARLDRLDGQKRNVISHAAVIGREFSVAGLEELTAGALGRIAPILENLSRKDLIERAGSDDAFRFRHALIRGAAYDSLPMTLRAGLHERHAQWLDSVGDSDEAVGYHLEQAVRMHEQLGSPDADVRSLAEQAGERLARAGRAALGLGEVQTAVALLERAVALFGAGTAQSLALTPDLAHSMGLSGSVDAAYRLLVDAEPMAVNLEPAIAMHVAVARRHIGLIADPDFSIDEILLTCERAIQLFEAHDDVMGLVSAWSLKAWAHVNQGRCGSAGEAAERGLELARRARASFQEALLLEHVCMALSQGPTPVRRAIARGTELLDLVEGRRRHVLGVAGDLALLHAMAGASDEARRLVGMCLVIVDELAIEVAHAAMAVTAAEVELLAGDPGAAERILRPQWELLARAGERADRAYLAAALARALEAQERWAEAARLTQDTEATAFEEDRMVQADWRATRARLLARGGEHASAEALAREAVAVAAETDALNLRADCSLSLAQVLRHGGKAGEAARSATDALAEYTAKENVVGVRRVEAWGEAVRALS